MVLLFFFFNFLQKATVGFNNKSRLKKKEEVKSVHWLYFMCVCWKISSKKYILLDFYTKN